MECLRNTGGYETGAWRHIYGTFATTHTEGYLDGNDGSWNGGSCDPLTGIDEITIGAFDTSDHLDAYVAEFGLWSVVPDENDETRVNELRTGAAPSFFPQNLLSYLPFVRDTVDEMGLSWTANGTLSFVQHPSGIYYPQPQFYSFANIEGASGRVMSSLAEAGGLAGPGGLAGKGGGLAA